MLTRSNDRKVTNAVSPSGKSSVIANAFGLPAGLDYSCPGATSFCSKICYAGRTEKQYKNVFKTVYANFVELIYADYLGGVTGMFDVLSLMVLDFIADCEKRNAPKYFRIHWDGDFFSIDYAKAWARICKAFPEVDFWVYTRSFDVVPIIAGIPNLAVYVSADPVNMAAAKECATKYGVSVATVADTFAEAKEYFGGKAYKCPENTKALPLITDKGSACGRCGVCPTGRGNVLFSVKKR